jgi:hypothetical protein
MASFFPLGIGKRKNHECFFMQEIRHSSPFISPLTRLWSTWLHPAATELGDVILTMGVHVDKLKIFLLWSSNYSAQAHVV